MRRILTAVGLIFAALGSLPQTKLYSQTTASGVGKSPSVATPTCPTTYRWYLPLSVKCSDKSTLVHAFFVTDGPVQAVTQVKYLYGFGQTASTISADLFSDPISAIGTQVAFGSSLSSAGTGSTSSTSGTSTASNSSAASTTPTTVQAAQQLENGGDFYIQGIYPLLYKGSGEKDYAFVIANPKIGFNFSGFGSQNTITETQEYNINTSIEGYAQAQTDSGVFTFYVDARTGWEHVQPQFATSMGLTSNNFLLTSGTLGVEIKGFLRVGFQQFFGPQQAFGAATASDFSKPHLVLQFSPHN